jgi:hypothetical protein
MDKYHAPMLFGKVGERRFHAMAKPDRLHVQSRLHLLLLLEQRETAKCSGKRQHG